MATQGSMRTQWIRAMLLVAVLFSAASSVRGAEPVRWRNGQMVFAPKRVGELALAAEALASRPKARHVVIQFEATLSRQQRQTLGANGVTLLGYLGNHAYFATIATDKLDATAVSRAPGLVDMRAIERDWKLHPFLTSGRTPEWAVVTPANPAEGVMTPVVGAYILFHGDVPLIPDATDAVVRHGGVVKSVLESINGLVIELPLANIASLANEDIVQWIEPPLPRFEPRNNANREITGANIVQEAPYNLDGSGVRVLIYDAGKALASHDDFGGRMTVGSPDGSTVQSHATHVAGTVGGSGAASNGLYRGMAPGVDLLTYGFEPVGGPDMYFLYNDPGDIEDDYAAAITEWGAQIANNSIGTNTCWNFFPCEITGNYGITAELIDTIATGGLGGPMRIVWANGNERDCTRCRSEGHTTPEGYHSTAPPACAKNHITVGALNANDDSLTTFTSWGPCDDGRIKPDVAAPGCEVGDDDGVTSCSAGSDNISYTNFCGTSMAAPTVTGLSALLLQDYRATFPDRDDFDSATLKALLAHTAQDLENIGPDYRVGYGAVRIQAAVDFMRTDSCIEAEVEAGGVYSVLVLVEPGQQPLKVTLAWDDVPGTPNVANALVNDLDLVVFDPSSVQHFPWTLDPSNPGAPAVRTQADHTNNIEQVFTQLPTAGAWRVEVRGFDVPQGPQRFSLCASPLLVNCSVRGVLSLDRSHYACDSVAVIEVVDCQLNENDETIETVTISLSSDSMPDGMVVTLTETNPASAAFRAEVPMLVGGGPDTLPITPGESVTARYVDADDGLGGVDVPVVVTAQVDCEAPEVSNVATIDLEARSARIAFSTSEPTYGDVVYGAACDDLSERAGSSMLSTAHEVSLSGLTDDTTYFYIAEVEDRAGNFAFADNGGLCFSFTTPSIPDFFTETFSQTDLGFQQLLFVPDGSNDFYAACVESIDALPTDPSGGTSIGLGVDDFQQITLAGETVSLYGTAYDRFFVGSNGYITFEEGDIDWTPSLSDHFSLPRIAPWFDDLNPSVGGVSYRQLSDRVTVTYENVPEFFAGTSNTFQVEMFFDGRITISYAGIEASGGITGLSAGNGRDPDYFETDLSAAGACGPRPPRANSTNVSTVDDTTATFALDISDDGLPDPPNSVSATIISLPAHGQLSDPEAGAISEVPYTLLNNRLEIIYAPDAAYVGSDTVQFKANDGGVPPDGGDSEMAILSIQVHPDCNDNGLDDAQDIAGEASGDCNANQIPDECDIAGGVSIDCASDGVPDECQSDCNENGVADMCDVSAGTSPDCNANGLPDECDIAGWASHFFDSPQFPPALIPDPGPTTLSLNIPLSESIEEVVLLLNIEHTAVGDLFIVLSHDGVAATMVRRCGGDADNFENILLADDANTPICSATPPFSGAYTPVEPLTIFDGMDMQGTWSIMVRDSVRGEAGSVQAWGLLFPIGSFDCNDNAVPDECEADCNANGTADDCDIAAGTSGDGNGDGIPDECQCAPGSGDADNDGDLDLRDFATLQWCFASGISNLCLCVDMDQSGEVDNADVPLFTVGMVGP